MDPFSRANGTLKAPLFPGCPGVVKPNINEGSSTNVLFLHYNSAVVRVDTVYTGVKWFNVIEAYSAS